MSYIEVIGFCKKYFLKEDLCFEDGLQLLSKKYIVFFSERLKQFCRKKSIVHYS